MKNSLDFEKIGFRTKSIIKDKYVQVLHLEKED